MDSAAATSQYDQMEEGKQRKQGPPRQHRFFPRRKKTDPVANNNNDLNETLFDPDEVEDVYIVKQRYGYFSLLFSLAQTIILAIMMWKCGVAPLKINPMVGPYPDALNEWGGKNAYDIIDEGQWWRLLTPILLHAGVIHLLCNVAVQIETGAFFEREWGSFNWMVVYLTSAVGSSILSTIVMPNAVSVGSSGAVMGLFGAKLAEVLCRACEREKTAQQRLGHQVRKEQCAGVLCSVVVVMLFSFIPYVDWAAHLGGLASGFLAGMVIFSFMMEGLLSRCVLCLASLAVTVTCFTLAIIYTYSGNVNVPAELKDVCGYYKQYFSDYQCNCMRQSAQ